MTGNNTNETPVDITLVGGSVDENASSSTVVATLSTVDADAGDSFSYAITSDPSGFFEIVGNEVRVASGASIDYEVAASHDVTIRVTDSGGLTYDEVVTLTVSDVNEGPTDLSIGYQLASGREQVSNSYEDGAQSTPAVAAIGDGGYVVTWASTNQDGSGYGIYGQRYDDAGNTLGEEFQANSYTTSHQNTPCIAGLADGGFVVSWTSYGQDGSSYSIVGQRFDAGGNSAGDEFQVNSTNEGYQYTPSITDLADGGFVVSWGSYNQDDSTYDVHAQRFDADGGQAGDEFLINTQTEGYQFTPSIASMADGGFVATWSSYDPSSGSYDVYGQRFDAEGEAVGDEMMINSQTDGYQFTPSTVGLEDGGFVTTWSSFSSNGSTYEVHGQRFDANSQAVGDEFQINTYAENAQYDSSVTSLADGGFMVTWSSQGQDGSGYGVYGQRFDAAGEAVGDEFQVNDQSEGQQYTPAVTALADGNVVVAWGSTHSGDANVMHKVYSQGVAENASDGTVVATVTGADADADAGDTLTYSLADDADGRFAIDASTGEITVANGALLNHEEAASHDVTVTVTDADGASYDETFTIQVSDLNEGPTATDDSGDTSENATLTLDVLANDSDVDAGDSSSLASASVSSGAGTVSIINDQLVFDPGSSYDHLAVGETAVVEVAYTAEDSGGLTDTGIATITITGTNDEPVLSSALADQAATEDAVFSFAVPADAFSDVDASDGLTYTATLADGSALPAWLTFDARTKTFSGTPENGDVGDIRITVTATDAHGASATDSFEISTANTNDGPDDLTMKGGLVEENAAGGTVVGQVSGSDVDTGDVLSYSLADDADGRFVIDADTGEITVARGASLDYEDAANHDVTVTVTDRAGAAYDETFSIEIGDVNENQAPSDITFTGANDTLGTTVTDLNPVGYWRLDSGEGTDETGGSDATMHGVTASDDDPFKQVDAGAARFDGANDYVEIPNADAWDLDAGTVQL
ncbi:MAG: cadherin domain-containing protein, partial [Geminicoccaceae bacterium]